MKHKTQPFEMEERGGTCSGYHCSPLAQPYQNFILDTTHDDVFKHALTAYIQQHVFDEVTVIKHLHVNESARGKGVGGALLEQALAHSEVALLVADGFEEQLPGFSLLKFYEDRGFVTLKSLNVGYLMMYPAELADGFVSPLSE